MALRKPSLAPLPVLPLKDQVLFPGTVTTVLVNRRPSIEAVNQAMKSGQNLFAIAQLNPDQDSPLREDLAKVGVMAEILSSSTLPDGSLRVVLRGQCRAIPTKEGAKAVEPPEHAPSSQLAALTRATQDGFAALVEQNPRIPHEVLRQAMNLEGGALADYVIHHLPCKPTKKQAILEVLDLTERLESVLGLINEETAILQAKEELNEKLKRQFDEMARVQFLREELQIIQSELKSIDGADSDLGDRIETADLPENVRQRLRQEWQSIKDLGPFSQEAALSRQYLEFVLGLPFSKSIKAEELDLPVLKSTLDSEHHGLHEAKQRIIELVCTQKLNPDREGGAVLFFGPPGTGKTSFAQSLGKALGRPVVVISLGGMKDEVEIRGHRRSYVGARAGRILQALSAAGCKNPILVLDEIDKAADSVHSTLLDLLDPSQNRAFVDSFVELGVDLSQVLFVATANSLEPLRGPLLDRLEVIEFEGYRTSELKLMISNYLWQRALTEHGILGHQLALSTQAIDHLALRSGRTGGVRRVVQDLAKLVRSQVVTVMTHPESKLILTPKEVEEILGPEEPDMLPKSLRPDCPGSTWCLLAAGHQGAVGMLEVAGLPSLDGKGSMVMTGSLGGVLRESAQTALTALRLLDPYFNERVVGQDLHLHMPASGIPKDGPSAGLGLALCLWSWAHRRSLPTFLAVSGEVSLNGAILPVGGIRQKLLACQEKGIRTVILPRANAVEPCLLEGEVTDGLQILFADTVMECLELIERLD